MSPNHAEFQVATKLLQTLKRAGFEAVFAGGCVRDKLLGIQATDYDIATSAKPEQVQALFDHTLAVGAQFGVILVVEKKMTFEVATFREDGTYLDGRRPEKVNFSSMQEDAKRRDFTVNGMYWDPIEDKIFDFVGGKQDLQAKLIRSIGKAQTRFEEDKLRMLRAIRFGNQLGFTIDPQILTTIASMSPQITQVSWERIRDEFSKLITSKTPKEGLMLLDKVGLLKHILPEVEQMKGVEQPSQYHPEGDVFVHTMLLFENLVSPEIELAMGCLLHDVAKPVTFERAQDRIRFHGHDVIGAKMSETILRRMAFAKKQIRLVSELVRDHLKFKDIAQMKKSTLTRFVSQNRFDLHLALHKQDVLASNQDLSHYEFAKKAYEDFLNQPPPTTPLFTGKELMELGYPSGPQMGKILTGLEDAMLEGTITNKAQARDWLKRHFPLGED